MRNRGTSRLLETRYSDLFIVTQVVGDVAGAVFENERFKWRSKT